MRTSRAKSQHPAQLRGASCVHPVCAIRARKPGAFSVLLFKAGSAPSVRSLSVRSSVQGGHVQSPPWKLGAQEDLVLKWSRVSGLWPQSTKAALGPCISACHWPMKSIPVNLTQVYSMCPSPLPPGLWAGLIFREDRELNPERDPPELLEGDREEVARLPPMGPVHL